MNDNVGTNNVSIETARCSFCGKDRADVKLLVSSENAHICDDCIRRSLEIVKSKLGSPQFRLACELLDDHFAGLPPEQIATTARTFPKRMRADLQAAIEQSCIANSTKIVGIHCEHQHEDLRFTKLLERGHYPKSVAPLQYEDVDVGEAAPVRCIVNALVLQRANDLPAAILVAPHSDHMDGSRSMSVEIATPAGEAGALYAQSMFERLEKVITTAASYRGKVLSLESSPHYQGAARGITVHKLRHVSAEEIILPESTIKQLDKNIVQFARVREKLRALGMSTKKGLLFHGPPGTGKTHTVQYLASCLPSHTTLLVTAEQVGLLKQYFQLARLLQPAMLVIEDVDLIARDRQTMGGGCEELLLNQLLNEMDGLRESADIFFILTTNRPETLEAALASRPGRIDQAIHFPLPDSACRAKLVSLYAGGLDVGAAVLNKIVDRTKGVSASFIKELMRRAAQELLSADKTNQPTVELFEAALEEMLFAGGKLNVKLLGGSAEMADPS